MFTTVIRALSTSCILLGVAALVPISVGPLSGEPLRLNFPQRQPVPPQFPNFNPPGNANPMLGGVNGLNNPNPVLQPGIGGAQFGSNPYAWLPYAMGYSPLNGLSNAGGFPYGGVYQWGANQGLQFGGASGVWQVGTSQPLQFGVGFQFGGGIGGFQGGGFGGFQGGGNPFDNGVPVGAGFNGGNANFAGNGAPFGGGLNGAPVGGVNGAPFGGGMNGIPFGGGGFNFSGAPFGGGMNGIPFGGGFNFGGNKVGFNGANGL